MAAAMTLDVPEPQALHVRRRAGEVVGELWEKEEPAKRRCALRAVRNEVIGNRTKKLAYVHEGAVKAVASILHECVASTESSACREGSTELIIQSAVTLGSFACGLELGAAAVINSGAVPDLIRLLDFVEVRVVLAATRALRLLFKSSKGSSIDALPAKAVELLIRMLHHRDDSLAEVAASTLARCCEVQGLQDQVKDLGGLPALIRLLQSKLLSVQEAAMDGLAAMTKSRRDLALAVCEDENAVATLVGLSKNRKPGIKMLACRCIANISTKDNVPEEASKLRAGILPIVVRLLEQQADPHVPHVLAALTNDSADLQKLAFESSAVGMLMSWLQEASDQAGYFAGGSSVSEGKRQGWTYLREGLLLAVGAVSKNLEDARRSVIDNNGIPIIVKALNDSNDGVRSAACVCAKSLSRSHKAIRTSLFEAKIDKPLLSLLSDPCPTVQAEASATLCNLVLDYSPMKENILAQKGVRELTSLSKSMDPTLRLHSTWAIKNLLYRATLNLKRRVMEELTWPQLLTLLEDPEQSVRLQAVTIIRNLVQGEASHIEPVVGYENGLILGVLEKILSAEGPASPEMKTTAMYAASNIASGSDKHKDLLMSTSVVESVLHCLKDQSCCELRVAAAWAIINLLWKDGDQQKLSLRVDRLKEIGVEAQLESMVEDPSLNVKDRVMSALKIFKQTGKAG